MENALGRVVISKAGRDKSKQFVILSIIDQEYVFIADGNLRKVISPKKKKIKHLTLTETVFDTIKAKLEQNIKINDTDIRKALEVIRRNL